MSPINMVVSGYGDGYGDGSGDGSGDGYGSGDGDGYGSKIAVYTLEGVLTEETV